MQPCRICSHPRRDQIESKTRAGESFVSIERWLSSVGAPAERRALSRHAAHAVLPEPRKPGPKPPSGKFLENVVSLAEQGLDDGSISVKLRDALLAQNMLDKRAEQVTNFDLMYVMAQAIGAGPAYLAQQRPAPHRIGEGVTVIEPPIGTAYPDARQMAAEEAADEADMARLAAGPDA